MLRNRADRASVACVLASTAGLVAWLATGRLVFLVPMIVALRWTALVQHNHSHVGLFRKRWVNRLLELSFGPVTFMPMELYRESHTRIHHPHTGTPQDWTQPTEVLGGEADQTRPLSRPRNMGVFVPRALVLGTAAIRRDPAQSRRLTTECALVAAVLLLPILIGSPLRLVPVVLLWVVVAVVSADANYKHHNGYLRSEEPTTFANDSFSPLHTTLGFNIGYHTAHHRRPNAHWSKLPALSGAAAAGGARQRSAGGPGSGRSPF